MKQDPVNRFIASQVARQRVQKRIRVADLAEGAGIPMGTVSNLLTGHCRLSLLNLHRLLARMGVGILEVWPETTGITPVVNARTIQVAVKEAEARLEPLVSIDDILKAVSRVYGVPPAKLASPSRERHLSEARAIAAHLVSEQPHLTVVSLSEALRRDVSSLFHVARRMKERLAYDRQLAERLDAVRKMVA